MNEIDDSDCIESLDYENEDEFCKEMRKAKPNSRCDPRAYRALFRGLVPDPDTIPRYTHRFIAKGYYDEYTTVTLDRERKLHSYAGKPAWVSDYGELRKWYKHSKLHRENGPAVIFGDFEEYWLEDVQYSKEEFLIHAWIYQEKRARKNPNES